ncbi:hypothetical protein V6N13_139722 [Hibiscus sabdariffa]
MSLEKVIDILNDKDEEIKMIMFGDYAYIVIQLMKPIACELGMRFSIEEGKKKIAVGVISSIIGLARLFETLLLA